MKRLRLQILVVVANIQIRSLKTEVEKGSTLTAIGYGLVGPKRQCIFIHFVSSRRETDISKGNHVNNLKPGHGYRAVMQTHLRMTVNVLGRVFFST